MEGVTALLVEVKYTRSLCYVEIFGSGSKAPFLSSNLYFFYRSVRKMLLKC